MTPGARGEGSARLARSGLPEDLDAWLSASEGRIPDLRQGAAKAILWRDASVRARTSLSVVYLHGFSADRQEMDPLPREVAGGLGANLYCTRLAGHGRDGRRGAAMAEASVADWLSDAAESMEIGLRLGERVIVVGTSTGGTLALWVAAQPGWSDRLAALVLLSPNLGVRSRLAQLVRGPWGRLLLRLVVGREYHFEPRNEAHGRHWTTRYPSSALLPMLELVRTARALPLEHVRVPVFMAYSPLDGVVDPSRALAALERIASPLKRTLVVEDVGDPQHHVLAGDILSPGTTPSLVREIVAFLERIT